MPTVVRATVTVSKRGAGIHERQFPTELGVGRGQGHPPSPRESCWKRMRKGEEVRANTGSEGTEGTQRTSGGRISVSKED